MTRRQISSTTGSVMAKQPIEPQPPCTITKRAGAVVGAVEDVGKAEVERAVPAARRVQRLGVDRIEALGSLAVALRELRAELARPAADRIDGEALEAVFALHPQLELELALEDADEDGRAEARPCAASRPGKVGEVGRAGERRAERRLRQAAGALGVDLQAVPVDEDVAATRTAADGREQQPSPARLRRAAPRSECAPRSQPARAHRPGAKLMLGGCRSPMPRSMPPVDIRPERCVPSSMLARLRIFGPGTMMRCSAICSPGFGLKGSGFGLEEGRAGALGIEPRRIAAVAAPRSPHSGGCRRRRSAAAGVSSK